MKLELKHLAPYLPYNVGCSYKEYKDENKRLKAYFTGISRTDGIETTYKRKRNGCAGDYIGFDGNNNISDLEFKLHLHPLSDLTKEIEVNGEKFIPIVKIRKDIEYKYDVNINYDGNLIFKPKKDNKFLFGFEVMKVQNMLYEWHFDIFGLIKENLAIDINTL